MKRIVPLALIVGLVSCASLGLQVVKEQEYEAVAEQGKAKMNARVSATGWPKKVRTIIVAEPTYTADFNGQSVSMSGSQYSKMDPMWSSGSKSVQLSYLATWLGTKLGEKLGGTGLEFDVVDANKVKGGYARNEIGKGDSFVSNGQWDYTQWDTNNILAAQGGNAVLYIRARGKWEPRSASRLNDEPVINYAVSNNFEVKLCTANNDCAVLTMREPAERQEDYMIPVTADHFKEKENFIKNNKWAQALNAQVIADVIFANWDKLVAK